MKMVQPGLSISILNGPNSACGGGRDVGFLSVPQSPFAGLARRGPAGQSQSSILDYESHFGRTGRSYSHRNATIGSTFDARRAGM